MYNNTSGFKTVGKKKKKKNLNKELQMVGHKITQLQKKKKKKKTFLYHPDLTHFTKKYSSVNKVNKNISKEEKTVL